MSRDEITQRICAALDAIDAHESARKEFLVEWKKEREILASDLHSFRKDALEMRLEEQG